MPKPKPPDKALALIGVSQAEYELSICASATGAHRLTEATVVVAYHALEEERKSDSDIPPLMIGKKLNLAYEAVLRERALYYLQSLRLEADASTVEILADIFDRQLYMHHPDQWGSLAEFLRNMAAGKSASYRNVIEALVTIILPFLQVEGVVGVKEMMSLITEGGMSNLYHLRGEMVAAVERGDKVALSEMLTDAKALGRSEIWDKYKRGKMCIEPAKAVLTHTNPGWQLVITMDDAQRAVILARLGRRISYE